jgi:rhamnulose-1-phosphate aldolase/alcohol dehydrogenase
MALAPSHSHGGSHRFRALLDLSQRGTLHGANFAPVEDRWDDAIATALADEVDQLVYLSNLVGADPSLTQPGGGNSSVKCRETDFAGRPVEVLRVKGSGTDLRTIGRREFTGLRLADLEYLRGRDTMTDEQMMSFMRASMLDAREPSPSVETPLHSVLPFRFIVHTHDFATQALTDTPRPEAWVREALGADATYIDYVRPGFPLAHAVIQFGALPAHARGLVLARHGLIAWGDTAKDCYANLRLLIDRAESFVAAHARGAPWIEAERGSAAARRERAQALLPVVRAAIARPRPAILHWDDSPEALAFAASPGAPELASRGMATPEHILRCGRVPMVLDADCLSSSADDAAAAIRAAAERFAQAHVEAYRRNQPEGEMLDPVPRVVVLPGLGIVTAMKDKANALVGNLCYRHVIRVMKAAEGLDAFRFLDESDAIWFEHWPLELVKLRAPEKELSRQVAVVTGAGSGIGRAIAERFAAEGAHLVLSDVAAEPLAETARLVRAACQDAERAVTIVADTAEPHGVAAVAREALLAFGGVDILVCNAGFLHAGPIDQVTDEMWDRHFDVNVKGAFLLVRELIPVMKAARRGVVLFNASKGAFAPTVDNAAYASAKAAVAALARNLAVELGPHGIRVNYFNADFVDTPLMRRLVADRAAMRGVTADAQLEEYRRRNAMQVGPIPPSAVAEAALFLASPRAAFTTGAVLTVDAGVKEAMPR